MDADTGTGVCGYDCAEESGEQNRDKMELSELTAYAAEKHHIAVQEKRIDTCRYSFLIHPGTGKRIAMLMRRWDWELGEEIRLCDIRRGQDTPAPGSAPYLTAPGITGSANWIGVRLDSVSDPQEVFRLIDRAVAACEAYGYTVILEERGSRGRYRDTPLSFAGRKPIEQFPVVSGKIPERIRQMMLLYEYVDGSYREKRRNFYLQGKFMEDYTDDAPWNGECRKFFATYHDLNTAQLRGYFTWRTEVRRGVYKPIAASIAFIYLYELLNGIGTASPEDSLDKLQEFAAGYLDAGYGDELMERNLKRWQLELAVLNALPPEIARRYLDEGILEQEDVLSALLRPQEHDDETVYRALIAYGGSGPESSPVVTEHGAEGRRLFARAWRHAAEMPESGGESAFSRCFTEMTRKRWYPLENAVYYFRNRPGSAEYVLSPCRRYVCQNGIWYECTYQKPYVNKKLLAGFLHEADRSFRIYLKTGRQLRERKGEEWAAPYIRAAVEADMEERREARRQRVSIDFSGLEQIRQDARITRDSLLTEEELAEGPASPPRQIPAGDREPNAQPEPELPLDRDQALLLSMLLRGEPVKEMLMQRRIMPTVAADGLNEALFDEIGDTAVECDGDELRLLEDYREDVARILGGIIGNE